MTQTIQEYVQEQEKSLLQKFLTSKNELNSLSNLSNLNELLQLGGEINYRDTFQNHIPCWCHISSDLQANNLELPFADESWQHILLVHELDHHPQPLLLIKEVLRVLKTGGKLTILGLNPYSVWRFYHQYYLLNGLFSVYRLRIWLKLSGCDSQTGGFAMYRFPVKRWLSHTLFLEKAGDRWFPSFGGLYLVNFIKKEKKGNNSDLNSSSNILVNLTGFGGLSLKLENTQTFKTKEQNII